MPKILVQITRNENCDYFNCDIGDIIPVEFEDYISSVVASQIGNAPIEACKAQAIAARGLALSRGVFRGKPISDSSSVAQAYRAARHYENATKGTKETEGQVLTYNNSIAVTHYSANNGGKTMSSQQRWGGYYPYLIQKNDPWDAATGKEKYGHGVGMSQLGAIYAANKGIDYKQILNFYYPNCKLQSNYAGLTCWEVIHMTKKVLLNDAAQSVVDLAESKLGDPYVYGTRGHNCIPTVRKQYASYHPQYTSKIYDACPVLSKKQAKCDGCKWQGHLCYDCRGFTWYVLKEGANIDIEGGGATSQYQSNKNWIKKGKIDQMPNVVCNVFKYNKDTKKMAHTGIHIGDGIITHCSTVVKHGAMSDSSWTHYAIPKGLYTQQELSKAGQVILMTTVKKGSSGAAVEKLQQWLNQLGYNVGTVDGKFGSATEVAVKMFQKDHNLTADGIVGMVTWDALEKLIQPQQQEQTKPSSPDIIEPTTGEIVISRELALQFYNVLKKYFSNT